MWLPTTILPYCICWLNLPSSYPVKISSYNPKLHLYTKTYISKWDSHLSMWIWFKIRYLNWITVLILQNWPKSVVCLVNFGTYGCGQRSQGHVPIPGTKPRGSAVCLAETTHICSVSPVEWRKPDDFHSEAAMISTPMHPWDITTKSLRLKWHHLSGKHSGPSGMELWLTIAIELVGHIPLHNPKN